MMFLSIWIDPPGIDKCQSTFYVSFTWDGEQADSGVYLVHMYTFTQIETKFYTHIDILLYIVVDRFQDTDISY